MKKSLIFLAFLLLIYLSSLPIKKSDIGRKIQADVNRDAYKVVNPSKVEEKITVVSSGLSTDSDAVKSIKSFCLDLQRSFKHEDLTNLAYVSIIKKLKLANASTTKTVHVQF